MLCSNIPELYVTQYEYVGEKQVYNYSEFVSDAVNLKQASDLIRNNFSDRLPKYMKYCDKVVYKINRDDEIVSEIVYDLNLIRKWDKVILSKSLNETIKALMVLFDTDTQNLREMAIDYQMGLISNDVFVSSLPEIKSKMLNVKKEYILR